MTTGEGFTVGTTQSHAWMRKGKHKPVSHSWSLIFFSSTLTVLIAKSTPMFEITLGPPLKYVMSSGLPSSPTSTNALLLKVYQS